MSKRDLQRQYLVFRRRARGFVRRARRRSGAEFRFFVTATRANLTRDRARVGRWIRVHARATAAALRKPSPKLLRRSLTAGALIFALVGVGLIAYPFATDLWAHRIQRGLSGDLAVSAGKYRSGEIKTGEA